MMHRRSVFLAFIVGLTFSAQAENATPPVEAGNNAVRAAVTGRIDGFIKPEAGMVTERPRGSEAAMQVDLAAGWNTMRESVLQTGDGEPTYLPLSYVFAGEKAPRVRQLAPPDAEPLPEERDMAAGEEE